MGKGNFRRGTKKRVTRLGGAIDQYAEAHGYERAFITLTCPGSSPRAVAVFSAWSGYLLDSLNGWIRRKQERFSGRAGICRLHVWELQKRGAEHLHYCVALSPHIFRVVSMEIRSWYLGILERICQLSSEDVFERANGQGSWRGNEKVLQLKVESVVNSVSAYLSKYLTKGLQNQQEGGSSTLSVPRPARLWGCSRYLARTLESFTTSHFWSLERPDCAQVVSAVQELIEKQHLTASVHTYHAGLTTRIRLFFHGNKQVQDETFSVILGMIGEMPQKALSSRWNVRMMRMLYRKAVRIKAKMQKRVAFNELYGNEITGWMMKWVSQETLPSFSIRILVTCLEDFDEISLGSSAGLKPVPPKARNSTQLVLSGLFTPRRST